jgi:hypothetical protein
MAAAAAVIVTNLAMLAGLRAAVVARSLYPGL